MEKRRKLKIGLVSSAGGHTSQLLKLASAWRGHKTFFVTTTGVVREQLREFGTVYVVGESNRQRPGLVLLVLLRCIRIVLKERPDVVISTGAAAGCMLCLVGKLAGARVIWIDSITNVDRISLSGTIVRRVADLFLVQWPELAIRYSRVEYVGAVI